EYHRFRERYRSPFAKPVLRASAAAGPGRELLAASPAGPSLREREGEAAVSASGIPVTRDILAGSAAEAARAAADIGYPVVMKVSSPDLLHKSDLGLVAVGVASAAAARSTYRELLERASATSPSARLEGVLVCEQVS